MIKHEPVSEASCNGGRRRIGAKPGVFEMNSKNIDMAVRCGLSSTSVVLGLSCALLTSAGCSSSNNGSNYNAGGMSYGGETMGTGGEGGMTSAAGMTGMGGETAAAGMTSTGGAMGGAGALRSVEIDMTGMTPHVNQLMQFSIVSASDQLAFRGVLDTLPSAAYNYIMPMSIPEGSYRLDFFADLSGDRMYEAPPSDHAWRVTIPNPGDQVLTFAHNTTFTDIGTPAVTPIGGDFMFQATGMTPHVGQSFELRVIIADTHQVLGRYVLGAVPGASFNLTIPGIIADATAYDIDFFADFNGNGQYDAPPTDHAWRVTGTGTTAGLTVPFAHNTTFTDVAF